MKEAVIIDAVRTPVARKDGAYAAVRPDELYAAVLNGLLDRTKIDGSKISDVITGCVTNSGEQGANVGRQAVLLSKLPQTVAGVTLSRMCGSSQQAVHFAAQVVAAGDAEYMIAGGVESMTRVPMFSDLPKIVSGASPGGGFQTLNPKLLAKYDMIHQGESAERIAAKYNLSRETLDKFSANSHVRAGRAAKAGYFDSQLVKVTELAHDEGIRPEPNLEKMGQLKPVFRKDGVITAANASQISDGAGALLIADREAAIRDGFKPRARFRARVAVGGDPTMQLLEVIPATKKALAFAGLKLSDMDAIEINEAFACVVLGWAKELEPDWEKVNPNGGAIAHGHPLGASGAVLMTKLLNELERKGGRYGLQVMCIGHGQATATILERL